MIGQDSPHFYPKYVGRRVHYYLGQDDDGET